MRRRRVIRATRVARASYWGWIWLVLALVVIGFFVIRCMRWI
jgi:hypothetical protein